MPQKSVLIGQNLSYSIHNKIVFSNISIALEKNKTGLIGRNGTGKSTLIKLLIGELSPLSGIIHNQGKIAYLPQDYTTKTTQTIAQALGVDKKIEAILQVESGSYDDNDLQIIGDDWDIVQQAQALLDHLGLGDLTLDRSTESLSGGQLMRIGIAHTFLQKPDFIILDEPTNNLDKDARTALYQLLQSFKGGCLIVSHDRHLLNIMDQILELSSLGLATYGGNYQSYIDQKK